MTDPKNTCANTSSSGAEFTKSLRQLKIRSREKSMAQSAPLDLRVAQSRFLDFSR